MYRLELTDEYDCKFIIGACDFEIAHEPGSIYYRVSVTGRNAIRHFGRIKSVKIEEE